MKCANCGKAEATSVWDSLVFEQNVSTGFVSEWATGYEKAGLCPACRQELARKNAAVLFPRKHQVLWILAGVLGAAGAALTALDWLSGYMNAALIGVSLFLSCLLLGYMKRKDNVGGSLLGLAVVLGIIGAGVLCLTLFRADLRERIDTLGWIGIALMALGTLVFWIGSMALGGRAARGENARDALLLSRARPDSNKRYVPLGDGLYKDKKSFLQINSLLFDKNEERVYDEFIASGKWKELVKHPEDFKFMGMWPWQK